MSPLRKGTWTFLVFLYKARGHIVDMVVWGIFFVLSLKIRTESVLN